MQPTVIINQHRQTAIVVANCGKKFHVIKLAKGKLRVTTLSQSEIQSQGYTADDYSPKLAAQSYLKHGAGVSKRAQQYLEEIAHSNYSDVLVFSQQ